ncbi:12062_t:CDS:2, partial [Entrophospora sp. SA101]
FHKHINKPEEILAISGGGYNTEWALESEKLYDELSVVKLGKSYIQWNHKLYGDKEDSSTASSPQDN